MVLHGRRRDQMSPRSLLHGRRWVIASLGAVGLLFLTFAVFASISTRADDTTQLTAEDLLLLTPDSLARVKAAAEHGDVVAQSTLGTAHLLGEHVPKNVTKAVYWFQEVVSRDEHEYKMIGARMEVVLKHRQLAKNGAERSRLEREYLELALRKLSYEEAFNGLLQVYTGGHGASYENPELALKYLRQAARVGYPWAQRTLGVTSMFGLSGAPQNKSEGLRLLKEAASQGDHDAEYILGDLYGSGVSVRMNPDAARYWFARAAPHVPKAAQRLRELGWRKAGTQSFA